MAQTSARHFALPPLTPVQETLATSLIASVPIIIAFLVLIFFFHGLSDLQSIVLSIIGHGEPIVCAVALIAGPALLLLGQDLVAPPHFVFALGADLLLCVVTYSFDKVDELGYTSVHINQSIMIPVSLILFSWSVRLVYKAILYNSRPNAVIADADTKSERDLAERLRRRRGGEA
jgi:hypothetical protein